MQERYDFMNEQRLDLEDSITKLRNVISEMTTTMQKQFDEKFKQINKNFNEVFIELFGGGKAELILEDEANILECGIDIRVQPPGKKLQNMMLLSGGEKALTAIAILFAILKINPAPFCILDEIEAALDDVNVARYALYLKKFSTETQFLVITHRKGTMEIADTVYGVTMEDSFFIPLFEKYELVTVLDTYVLENICRLQQQWRKQGYNIVPISVNESRLHLYNENHINDLIDLVNKYNVQPNTIELEMTETTVVNNVELAKEAEKKMCIN